MENERSNVQVVSAQELDLLQRLDEAEQRCARRKRSRPDAIAYRCKRLDRMVELAQRLADGSWRPAPGLVFVTTRPKHREVHAARYSDRVVHHLIAQVLAPELDRRLSPAAFACRPGKGTHAAVRALREAMWRMSRHGSVRVYALQMDVVNFFHSIDREILWRHLQAPIRAAVRANQPPFDLAASVWAVLNDEPGRRATRVGDPDGFARVPPHKRLGQQPHGVGLPIGNLTSQWFANAYLDPLDTFVQRTLGLGAYFRYMDDFVILCADLARLEEARQAIVAFLHDRLRLAVKLVRPIGPASAGVDFCGFIVRAAYVLPRRRTVAAWRQRCIAAAGPLAPIIVPAGKTVVLPQLGRVYGPIAAYRIDGTTAANLRGAWTSGRGLTAHAACRRLVRRARQSLPALARFLRDAGGKVALRLGDPRAESLARPWPNWPAQRQHLRAASAGAVLMVQLGRLFELVDRRDARRVGVPWRGRGSGRGCGVVHAGVGARIGLAIARGWPVTVAVEHGGAAGAVRNRVIRWHFEPLDRTAGWWRQATGCELDTARCGIARWPATAKWMSRRWPNRRAVATSEPPAPEKGER